ncbi:MAG: cell division protein FtsZ [Patescibacteria group bacterium]
MAKLKSKENLSAKIKVIGIGGCGGNAISRMYEDFPRSVDLIAINTDIQDLNGVNARKKIHIGKNLTRGLGTGMNPDLGRQAAEESRSEIIEVLKGADMIFITAGEGGGTGSSGAPVVAEIAKELGILTIAVVTKPFSFEGSQRMRIAQEGITKLRGCVDALITIPNDKIFSVINKDTSLLKAFEAIDEVLKSAVLGITELIMSPGIVNIDFADVKTIMNEAGSAIIGIGVAGGQERASRAVNMAINSPLLETSIEGAKGVLFGISGHKDLKMSEINEIAKLISESVDHAAKIIFGAYHDRKLNKGQLKITLIATGFNGDLRQTSSLSSSLFASNVDGSADLKFISEKQLEESNPSNSTKLSYGAIKEEKKEEKSKKEKSEEIWEIPAFLRKRKR